MLPLADGLIRFKFWSYPMFIGIALYVPRSGPLMTFDDPPPLLFLTLQNNPETTAGGDHVESGEDLANLAIQQFLLFSGLPQFRPFISCNWF